MARDFFLDAMYSPTYEEIVDNMNEPARKLWQGMNTFIQEQYKASPKITYSKCSGKPGWNVKYQKSGKSLCTLYPEREGFVALVVVTMELARAIKARSGDFEQHILDLLESSQPFNGTLWLMIQVNNYKVLNNVQQLIQLKHEKIATRRKILL